jgi:alkylation response protein AidB-like acyl-CoA dehydrogenase
MDDMLTESIERLLAEQCDAAVVRKIEAGEPAAALWAQLQESGFADALVSEEAGGAGLALREVAGLVLACGRHLLPLPLAQTLLARGELSRAGISVPDGPIAFAEQVRRTPEGALVAHAVPFGLTAEWVWASTAEEDLLLPLAGASRTRSGGHNSLHADVRWSALPAGAVRLPVRLDLRATGAAVAAGLLAGAMERAGEMAIAYANDRVQFGKPIGKLQAIQQQLSVMCEQMYAARSAALLGLSSADHRVNRLQAAVAKSRASEAATTVAAVSHAVHGAIGITAEYDLQLFTRRLHEWRRDHGGEGAWHRELGEAVLASTATPLEFARSTLAPVLV